MEEFKTEEEFLKAYNPDEYEKLSLTTDILVCSVSSEEENLGYTDIVFNMMPEYFTLGEHQQAYEVILGKKPLDSTFRRNKVEKTTKIKSGGDINLRLILI